MDTKQQGYAGDVKSALARVRRTLKAHAFPLGKKIGRYYAFGPAQQVQEGWNASRVGCSDSIALHYWQGQHRKVSEKDELPEVVAMLRNEGLHFDDRGWLLCNVRAGGAK